MRLRVNTGGNLSPSEVIGRDPLIERLWDTLRRQSIQLTAERRMGKTAIVKKMQAEARDGFLCFYRDVESCTTPAEFVERVAEDVSKRLPAEQQAANWLKDAWDTLEGLQVGSLLALCFTESPLVLDDLLKRTLTDDADALRHVLRLLERDHYLHYRQGGYGFQLPFIARVWRGIRRL
jgi:hypothetical protein